MCRGLTNAWWEFHSVYGPNESWLFLAFSATVKDCCTFSCKIKTTKPLWLHHMLYIPEQYPFISSPLPLALLLHCLLPHPHTPTQLQDAHLTSYLAVANQNTGKSLPYSWERGGLRPQGWQPSTGPKSNLNGARKLFSDHVFYWGLGVNT